MPIAFDWFVGQAGSGGGGGITLQQAIAAARGVVEDYAEVGKTNRAPFSRLPLKLQNQNYAARLSIWPPNVAQHSGLQRNFKAVLNELDEQILRLDGGSTGTRFVNRFEIKTRNADRSEVVLHTEGWNYVAEGAQELEWNVSAEEFNRLGTSVSTDYIEVWGEFWWLTNTGQELRGRTQPFVIGFGNEDDWPATRGEVKEQVRGRLADYPEDPEDIFELTHRSHVSFFQYTVAGIGSTGGLPATEGEVRFDQADSANSQIVSFLPDGPALKVGDVVELYTLDGANNLKTLVYRFYILRIPSDSPYLYSIDVTRGELLRTSLTNGTVLRYVVFSDLDHTIESDIRDHVNPIALKGNTDRWPLSKLPEGLSGGGGEGGVDQVARDAAEAAQSTADSKRTEAQVNAQIDAKVPPAAVGRIPKSGGTANQVWKKGPSNEAADWRTDATGGGGEGGVQVGDRVLQIGDTADAGDSARASREDHVHQLALLSDGGLAFDAQKRLHVTGSAVAQFTSAQKIALLSLIPEPAVIFYNGSDDLAPKVKRIEIGIPNPELLTGDVWVQGWTQGQPGGNRIKWTTSTPSVTITLIDANADAVASAIVTDGREFLEVRLRFYDAAAAGNEIERVGVNIPLVHLDTDAEIGDKAFSNPPSDLTDAEKTAARTAIGAGTGGGSGGTAESDTDISGALDLPAASSFGVLPINEDIERGRKYKYLFRVGSTNRFMFSSSFRGDEFLDLAVTSGTSFGQGTTANLLAVTCPRPDVDGVRTFFMARPSNARQILVRVENDYNVVKLIKLGGIKGDKGDPGSATVQTLTSAASITWDVNSGEIATLVAAHNFTLNISGGDNGTFAILRVLQDATGSRVMTLHSSIVRDGRSAPVLSTAANAHDNVLFMKRGTTWVFLGAILNG